MEVHGEHSVLVNLMRCMGWVYGRILGGVGGGFVVIPYLRWEMTSRLDSYMIFGVQMQPLRKPFQFYLVLIA